MLQASLKRQTDVVVVGSGPGGATLARELARAGKNVVLLEMGRDHRGKFYYGTHLGALIYGDKSCLLFTEEGLNVVRPIMTGGATNMFTGSAARPPPWLKERYGVDIDVHVEQVIKELRLDQLPDDLLGTSSKRLMEAGNSLGYDQLRLRRQVHAGLQMWSEMDGERVRR
jgi:choline dehydrogenase-like flavoprotein